MKVNTQQSDISSFETLISHEDRLHLTSSLQECVLILDANGTCCRFNEPFLYLTGYSRNEIVGKSLLDFVHSDEKYSVQVALKQVAQSTGPVDFLHRFIGRNGVNWITWRGGSLNHNGNIIAVGRAFSPKSSPDVFLELMKNSSIGVFKTSVGGQFLEINTAFANMLQYDTPQQVFDEVKDISACYVGPLPRQEILRRLERDGLIQNVEIEFRRRNGSTAWLALTITSVTDPKGNIDHFRGLVIDISAKNRIEDEYYLLLLTFENTRAPIMLLRPDKTFQYVNTAATQTYGYDRRWFLDTSIDDIDIGTLSQWWDSIWKQLKKKRHKTLESIHTTRMEYVFPVELHLNLFSFKGEDYISIAVDDITERHAHRRMLESYQDHLQEEVDKRTEELQRANDQLKKEIEQRRLAQLELQREVAFKSAIAEISDVIFSSRFILDDLIDVVLNTCLKLTGSSFGFVAKTDGEDGTLIGHTISPATKGLCTLSQRSICLSVQEPDVATHPIWGSAMVEHKTYAQEHPLDHPDVSGLPKGHVPIDRILIAPATVAGKLLGLVALANAPSPYSENDIHIVRQLTGMFAFAVERHQAEEALRKNEERYRILYEQSVEGIVITNKNFIITDANERAKRILGIDLANESHCDGRELFLQPLENKDNFTIDAVLVGVPARFEIDYCRPDGRHRPIALSVKRISTDEIQILILDIEQRKKIEDELIRARDAAEQANKAKSDFLARMSHEIRTPMNAIVGLTDLVLHMDIDETVRDYLLNVRDSSDHLLLIINDVLDLSKIEANKLVLDIEDFDVREMIHSALKPLEFQACKKDIQFTVVIDENVPKYVLGDAHRIRQILVNLAGNAVKFTHVGSVDIFVRATNIHSDSVQLQFQISDTGIGISLLEQQSIFDTFGQACCTHERSAGGTGLGLSISKHLAEMMGGTILVTSRPWIGSTFTFDACFPMGCEPSSEQRSPLKSRVLFNDAVPKKILIIDDNKVNLKVGQALITRLGHTADTASSGFEGLHKLSCSHYDLVLMDLEMPEMDGLNATHRIRRGDVGEKLKNIPIVAMTAHAFSSYRDQCLSAGMNDFLAKPVEYMELAHMLGEIPKGTPITQSKSLLPAQEDALSDYNAALSRLGDDKDLYNDIREAFLIDIKEKRPQFESAFSELDWDVLTRLAHSTKGNCASLGAELCRQAALDLERTARQRETENINAFYDQFKKRLDEAETAFLKQIEQENRAPDSTE
ncbi:PAS domain S-box protein [Desulfovibrio inopinatus]|uniref:PAS domain S-box protein n=1 Tax=Desulfovibrio inopinatus TaxID=102109 RepID=UPI0003F7F5D0|nr:PAS domain S-box protein [Desulfovibrio inopinatus]